MSKLLLAALLLLAGLVGVTLLRAAARERAAEAAYPPDGDFVTVEGHRVHYTVTGEGPDLVLIHGASGNLRDMTFGLAERLAAHYRVIAFDRPGLGYTDRIDAGGASIGEQAALLARAAALLGADRPVVMGQSYGGAVALAWAVNHPETLSALVLVAAPSYPWEGGLPRLYKVNAHPVFGPLAIPFLTAWVPQSYVDRAVASVFEPQQELPGYADHIGAPLTLRRHSLRENALQRASLKGELAALSERYDGLDLPIEIVHGTADETVALTIHSQRMAQELPTANLATLEGIGHMPHHARPGAVVEAIHRAADRAGIRTAPGP